MSRIQDIYRKFINSLFGDVEVFYGLPFRWRIRGALAIGFLYLAIIVIVFLTLYPAQYLESFSINSIVIGYIFLFIGVSGVILPIFIPSLRNYPGWVILVTIACFIVSFNIILDPAFQTDNKAIHYAFFIGLLAITFGARLYARVIREVIFEKTRIDTEIKLAQKIQSDLLPVIDIDEEYFQAFGKTVNAQEVGGDFFDVIKHTEGRVAFCVGDVSGHNIAAGLIMGIVKSAFRTELRYNSDLKSIVGSLNTTVREQKSKGIFVSFAGGLIDIENKEVEFVHAGHLPVIHFHNNNLEEIRTDGTALGLTDLVQFSSVKRKYSKGDIFVCYTDGIVEARNRYGEEFGLSRLKRLINRLDSGRDAGEIYGYMMSGIEEFTNGMSNIDDITLMVLKMK